MPEATTATAPERRMRWIDGFVLSLTMPASLIAALGYSIGALGAWTAIFLWGVSMVLATLCNWIYTEMAAMFPDTPGGIPMDAHEGWRSRLSIVAPRPRSGTGSPGPRRSRCWAWSSARWCRPRGCPARTGASAWAWSTSRSRCWWRSWSSSHCGRSTAPGSR